MQCDLILDYTVVFFMPVVGNKLVCWKGLVTHGYYTLLSQAYFEVITVSKLRKIIQ